MATVPVAAFTAGQGCDRRSTAFSSSSTGRSNGPIKLTITRPRRQARDLDKDRAANALVEIFGLAVSYAGTRPARPAVVRAPARHGRRQRHRRPEACQDGRRRRAVARRQPSPASSTADAYEFRKDGTAGLLDGGAFLRQVVSRGEICQYPKEDKGASGIKRVGDSCADRRQG